jgi:hypothetical protein
MRNFAAIALERMQVIVSRLPDVDRTDNPPGCYFLVRRKIFAQIATVIDQGKPVTMVAFRPDPGERDALLAMGRPYFSSEHPSTRSGGCERVYRRFRPCRDACARRDSHTPRECRSADLAHPATTRNAPEREHRSPAPVRRPVAPWSRANHRMEHLAHRPTVAQRAGRAFRAPAGVSKAAVATPRKLREHAETEWFSTAPAGTRKGCDQHLRR